MVFRKVYIVLCAALLAAETSVRSRFAWNPVSRGSRATGVHVASGTGCAVADPRGLDRQCRGTRPATVARRPREQAALFAGEILQLESRIFEVRNAKGRLIDKINTIEQEWVLANLNGAAQQPAEPAAESPAGAIPDSLKVRNLVFNPYFREQLPEADYAALRRAQGLELDAVDYVNRYFANYGTICELAEAYAAAQTEADAGEIYDRYNTLQGFNRVLARFARRGMGIISPTTKGMPMAI